MFITGALRLQGTESSYITGQAQPLIYRTGSSSGSYPFDNFGHLIIQTRTDSNNRDIIFATGTGSANQIVINSNGDMKIPDGKELQFGGPLNSGDGDLRIHHNGSNSFIDESSGTGRLIIRSSGLDIKTENSAETMATFNKDGAVELYYNNDKTFYTTSAGIHVQAASGVQGQITLSADANEDNNDKFKLVVEDGGPFKIQNRAQGVWETNIECNGNHNVELYYNNGKRFETLGSGVQVTGAFAELIFNASNGAGNQYKLRASGTNSKGFELLDVTLNQRAYLYHNSTYLGGVHHFHTDGTLRFAIEGPHVNIANDTSRLRIGASADLQLYHDGNSYIDNDSGWLRINTATDGIEINKSTSEYMGRFIVDGAVELYHNNTKKFETSSSGATVTGALNVTGDITVPTSMDSTNAGGVAIQRFWSASVNAGNVYKCGHWHEGEGAVQLLISVRSITGAHSGTTTYIFQGGFRALEGSGNYDGDYHRRLMPLAAGAGHGNGSDRGLSSSGGWEVLINQQTSYTYGVVLHVPSGRTNKALQVTVTELNRGNTFTDQSSSAAYSSITTSATPIYPSGYNYLGVSHLRDNVKINLGNDNDLQIYHDGSHSYIQDSGTGHLKILGSKVQLLNADGSEEYLHGINGGAVKLRYNNVVKFETTASGNKATGKLGLDDGTGSSGNYLSLGQSDDLKIYHDGSNNYIEGNNQKTIIRNTSNNIHIQAKSGEAGIDVLPDSYVKLYHDGSERFVTTSWGNQTTGGLHVAATSTVTGSYFHYKYGATGAAVDGQRHLSVTGNEAALEVIATDGGDHAGSLILRGNNDGYAFINSSDNNRLEIVSFAAAGGDWSVHGAGNNVSRKDFCIVANQDGAVELYHNNSKKAETFGSGFKVSGGGELYIDGNAASGHCQINMTRSDRSWAINNETNLRIYTASGNNGNPASGSLYLEINHVGDLMPGSNASQDLGTSSRRWDNLYINDLQLSNKGKTNDVDGTWGDWTLQEGESDVYMINNRSGKKFKIKMEEV